MSISAGTALQGCSEREGVRERRRGEGGTESQGGGGRKGKAREGLLFFFFEVNCQQL